MDKKLNIKFYSQHSDDIEQEWQDKACGIACLKMALSYSGKGEEISAMDLIKEGKYIGGYNPLHGWLHDSLVNILRNYGLPAYRQEFRSHSVNPSEKNSTKSIHEEKLISVGVGKIIQSIEKGSPVVISVKEGFDTNNSTHLILLVGFKIEDRSVTGFFYFDPNKSQDEGIEPQFMSLDRFNSNWRKLAIFVA